MSWKAEWGVYLLLILTGILYLLAAVQYPIGDAANPGPGLMPRILGIVIIGLAGYLLAAAWLGRKTQPRKPEGMEDRGQEKRTPLWVTVILIVYTATLNLLGFALGSFLAVFILGKIMGLEGWKKSMVLSIGVIVCAQLLFGFALDVPLPKGAIWGR
jgi:branched-subunit amino acid transport protein AzlD